MNVRQWVFVIGLCLASVSVPLSALSQSQFAIAALTLEQAANKVLTQKGGRILGAETDVSSGDAVHIIRLLSPDGSRVRHFRVDPKSGRISVKGKH